MWLDLEGGGVSLSRIGRSPAATRLWRPSTDGGQSQGLVKREARRGLTNAWSAGLCQHLIFSCYSTNSGIFWVRHWGLNLFFLVEEGRKSIRITVRGCARGWGRVPSTGCTHQQEAFALGQPGMGRSSAKTYFMRFLTTGEDGSMWEWKGIGVKEQHVHSSEKHRASLPLGMQISLWAKGHWRQGGGWKEAVGASTSVSKWIQLGCAGRYYPGNSLLNSPGPEMILVALPGLQKINCSFMTSKLLEHFCIFTCHTKENMLALFLKFLTATFSSVLKPSRIEGLFRSVVKPEVRWLVEKGEAAVLMVSHHNHFYIKHANAPLSFLPAPLPHFFTDLKKNVGPCLILNVVPLTNFDSAQSIRSF